MTDWVVGTRFWKRVKKMEKWEIERRRKEEQKKKEMRKKKKLEQIIGVKEKYFLAWMEGVNIQEEKNKKINPYLNCWVYH